MALPFLNGASRKKRSQILAVDLGTRTTKAVLIERHGEALALSRYALLDAPIYDKKFSAELLSEHLRSVNEAIGGGGKYVTLAIGLDDAIVRQVELPQMPKDDMRQVLKTNTRGYLQQDLPAHVFDCHIFTPKIAALPQGSEPVRQMAMMKLKVLVAGAKQSLIDEYQMAIKNAGMIPECIIPGLIGPVNSFEMAMPQVFANDSVALIDIGFKHSTISVLDRGELALSRVVNIGGDKLTAGLAEAMGVTYAEAEGVKLGMAPEAKAAVEAQVSSLGRELRASLDFFEHQSDRPVSQVYVTGGASKSEQFLQMMHSEMIVECKPWNPTTFLQVALPGQQAVDVEHVGPQLSVAIGAALASF